MSGTGHWALTRYDDVWYVSRHPHIFSSSPSITIPDQNPELAEFFGSMIVLDDPRHLRLRNIVNRAFTPKVVARTEASVRERARRLVDSMIADHPDGTGELVAELPGPLPLQVICDMIGIPEEDHQTVFHWTNVILGLGDPDFATDHAEYATVSMDFGAYAMALADNRRAAPRDDLTTALVQAEVDGERLTSSEIASFFMLLAISAMKPLATRSATACSRSRAIPTSARMVGPLRRSGPLGRRGDRAVGIAGDLHAPQGHRDHRAERHEHGGRRQGDDVVLLRQPRRSEIRPPVDV